MTVHTLYIFTRRGVCLLYQEWNRPRHTLRDTPEEDQKLMYGLLFSLKQLVNNLSPSPSRTGMTGFKTKSYTLHLFESPTGYRFAVTSDGSHGDMRPWLRSVYSDVFVPYVLRNPLYKMHTPITNYRFKEELAKAYALVARP